MGLDFAYIEGQTPLEEDEKVGLLLPTISTREELDEFEQQNIEEAIQWIVSIHCFPNGNGRHSRLMGDVIVDKIYNLPVFSWGAGNRVKPRDARTNYLNAVREADKNNYEPLLLFARS